MNANGCKTKCTGTESYVIMKVLCIKVNGKTATKYSSRVYTKVHMGCSYQQQNIGSKKSTASQTSISVPKHVMKQ